MQTMVSFRLSTKYMWGLRFKWNGELVDLNKMLHEKFHSTKPKFFHLFQVDVVFANYFHYCKMDLTYKVIRDQNPNHITQRWVGDY